MEGKIKELIINFVKEYQGKKGIKTKWRQPLISFSDAHDHLYPKLKEVVSPTHGLPTDFLEDAQTVIAYFIPFHESVISTNVGGKYSSREWAMAYVETNELVYSLNKYINNQLMKLNYNSSILPATHNFDEEILLSDWSHRHVAYISGLGKFGLNNMLITKEGCCGRLGSIVTNIKLKPTERKTEEHCLYKTKGTCKKCVKQCVNSALKEESFNRHKCYEMLLENNQLHSELGLTDACGKCCVNLPCSTTNPVSR